MAQEQDALAMRVKRFRENNNMSVRALAARVGVTPSFIYQLEQGKVSASYSTLKSIASALHTSVSVLAGDEVPTEWFLVKKHDRRKLVLDGTGMAYELLNFTGARAKRMHPLFFTLDAGAEERGTLYEHEREEFVFLIEGQLEIVMAGKKYTLEGGDALYFMFERPEVIRNTGESKAQGILVVSPPGV